MISMNVLTTVRVIPQVRSGTDDKGSPVMTDGPAYDAKRCDVQPASTSAQDTERRDATREDLVIYVPAQFDVSATDHLEVAGLRYRISSIKTWGGDALAHSEIHAYRWEG